VILASHSKQKQIPSLCSGQALRFAQDDVIRVFSADLIGYMWAIAPFSGGRSAPRYAQTTPPRGRRLELSPKAELQV